MDEPITQPTILKHEVNAWHRQYYIDKVNEPLLKAITILGNRYPMPTEENVLHPNSKKLVVIWKKYLEYEGNLRVGTVVSALFRIAICKLEHSPNYRDRLGWFVEELAKCDWKSRAYNHPVNDWKEPKPYGT